MRTAIRTLPVALAALLAACGGDQPSTTVAANTTEVIATENVTTSDAMVTNIDAAAPVGGAADEEAEAPGDNMTGNAL